MKFYNDFNAMFNAQSGLNTHCVFNRVLQDVDFNEFEVNDGQPLFFVQYDKPMICWTASNADLDSDGWQDAAETIKDVVEYIKTEFGINCSIDNYGNCVGVDPEVDVLSEAQAKKVANMIDKLWSSEPSVYDEMAEKRAKRMEERSKYNIWDNEFFEV